MTRSSQSEKFDSERLLHEWRWLCPRALTVIDRNAFGDLFLSDEMGSVHMLDVGGGEFSVVAESIPEFTECARTPEMQQTWFHDSDVKSASDRGLIPSPGQCIGFSTPVVFGGGGAYIAYLYEHVGFLGDIHRQIADVPDGGKVRLIVGKAAPTP